MKRIGIAAALAVYLGAATATAEAQAAGTSATDWHVYGGGVLGGEEYTRGAFGGTGITNGTVYAGVDGHALWLTDEGLDQLARLIPRGVDFELATVGLDVAVGPTIRTSTGRTDFIPVGIIGYTTAELEACYRSDCESESETEANFGAGFVAAFKGESGRGLHAGFRWTRNYGAALSVGFVFQTGGS